MLATLEAERFGVVLLTWRAKLWGAAHDRPVALDGKTLRPSFDRAASQSPVHSVAAFASQSGLVLGQVALREKETEIVAILRLLELVDLQGATVTISRRFWTRFNTTSVR